MQAPDFWRRNGWQATLLTPLAGLVTLAGRRRWARARPWRASVPVICVGNLVAGGAGKTPVAIDIARQLGTMGLNAHFLTRGYGGRERGPLQVDPARHVAATVGDEPLLLAGVAPTWVARDRKAGAEAAVTAGARAIVMDDGFQNPALAEDLSLIVVDGGYGFGNGRVMPAGPLREPVGDGLARADAVVRIGLDSANVATAISGALPVLEATLAAVEPEALGGRDVVAFAGIGRPAKFFETLEGLGCRLVARHAFPDHHPYRRDEVTRLIDEAAKANALAVTTAKDAVRLPVDLRQAVTVCEVALRWTDSTGIQALLRRTVGHG